MIRDNISKKDVLKKINLGLGIPISFSEKILDLIFLIILQGLKKKNKVKIHGFGTFKIINKKERPGRNPKTKQEYLINARKVITFIPSKEIKKRINEKK
tara:strand:+ start:16 stop:312 length:297 start_codon:yes stop_codon:yes gene_type:complete